MKNDFVRAGRFDLARAVERWGGLFELAEELGYEVATSSSSSSSSEWQEHISQTAASTGLSGKQGLFELASATYKRRAEGSLDDILGSIDIEDLLGSADIPSDSAMELMKEIKDSSLPRARDEIDAW